MPSSLSHTILSRALAFIPVLMSLSVHEWAHAWTARALGDTTAKEQGRLTLNPMAHIDLVGTLVLPLLGVPFGWAKPVPVEPTRFRSDVSMSKGMLLTAAAGPFSNLMLLLLSLGLLSLGQRLHAFPGNGSVVESLLERLVVINGALCVFNLLPIPPLDGSRVIDAFVPYEHRGTWRRFGQAGGVILLVVAAFVVLPLGEGLFAWLGRR